MSRLQPSDTIPTASKVDVTLEEIAGSIQAPTAGPRPTKSLRARQNPLASTQWQRKVLADLDLCDPETGEQVAFERMLQRTGWPKLTPAELEIFQINLGKLCNMTCRHCHVDAGPDRTDAMMSDATVEACLEALDRTTAHTVDLTGGAPELHPRFRDLVDAAVARGKHVIDRCNLTVLLVRRYEDLPQWFADRGVEVVASLPHYRQRNTDAQRGDGTFEKSIEALRRLNAAGYGQGDPDRVLTLVSNPAGAFLGGQQATLEAEWKTRLAADFDVTFDRLFVLNNIPISRFLEWLEASGNLQSYLETLVNAYNPATVGRLMCRNTLSVGWDGRLYDCDFNQMLDLELEDRAGLGHIAEFNPAAWRQRTIVTERHCFGCTAGAGSSCGGQTA